MLKIYQEHNGDLRSWNGGDLKSWNGGLGGSEMVERARENWEREKQTRSKVEEEVDSHFKDFFLSTDYLLVKN